MTCAARTSPPQGPRETDDRADHQALLDSGAGRPEAFSRLIERQGAHCLAVARQVLVDLPSDYDLEVEAHRHLLGQQTVQLLRELPEGERRCLMLAYWGGCTMNEIAADVS